MQARMKHPALALPGVLESLQLLGKATDNDAISPATRKLVELRASQINGCGVCVDMHCRELKKLGQSDERVFAVAAWRHTPYFDDQERAALALAEALTRLSDNPDPVPDSLWAEATRHYDERQLATLLVCIAQINVWNRLNAAVGQIAGAPWH
ncbi:MAG: carboxymuconolactone decarboxylase family protein [Myxococcales bacterium]|nr:MAG: carboxymuconolactone decarboxylase family protein [Myxococcales bacterium]